MQLQEMVSCKPSQQLMSATREDSSKPSTSMAANWSEKLSKNVVAICESRERQRGTEKKR